MWAATNSHWFAAWFTYSQYFSESLAILSSPPGKLFWGDAGLLSQSAAKELGILQGQDYSIRVGLTQQTISLWLDRAQRGSIKVINFLYLEDRKLNE